MRPQQSASRSAQHGAIPFAFFGWTPSLGYGTNHELKDRQSPALPNKHLINIQKSMTLAERAKTDCINQCPAPVSVRSPMAREDIASEFVIRALRHLLATNPFHFAALKRLKLCPAGLPIADFDRINAPHGSQLRTDLAPLLLQVASNRVTITALGEIAVDAANEPPWHGA
jgi:hypothetical protein